MKCLVGLLAALFILVNVSAGNIFAQGIQTGTIRGAVVDETGLPMSDVIVVISSSALQGLRSGITAVDGSYVFRSLPPGDYELSYHRPSFAPVEFAITVPLGGTVEQDATLHPAGVTEVVQVMAGPPSPMISPTVSLNITQSDVEALATSRTLQGIATLSPGLSENSPNAGQVVVNGAFAFDNIFMVNGVDVNDNVFGAPQSLFIEDAIQETEVLTSGITAEYGRFSGGVVNAVTKSGGNVVSGSYRLNLSNPAWTRETPFDVAKGVHYPSSLNESHEATVGGPVVTDRLWYFGAARLANIQTAGTLNQTGLAYNETDNDTRGEIKLTATASSTHTVQFGYLNNHRDRKNRPSFDFSIDQFALGHQTQPNWYAFVNYRGAPRENLLAEAQYSERRFAFKGVGGTSPIVVDSPFLTVFQDLAQYNAPYFDATDPEERNNRQMTGSLTSFVDRGGRHELKGGYEWFRSQNKGGGSQSATGYVFDADYAVDSAGNPLFDSSGHLMPIFSPGATLIENWLAQRGAVLNVDTQSIYAQDHWRLNRHASADLGIRYERVRSEATGGIVGVDTDTIVPRFALAYDVHGNGQLVLHATYGHYSGRYDEAQIGVNSTVGNPDRMIGAYVGPAGQGRAFAPGFDPANYQFFTGVFPTANIRFEQGLSSPVTKEFTLSAGKSIGSRGYGEATYVSRRTTNVIEDFINLSNGVTHVVRNDVSFGTFTNIVYRNSGIPQRHFQSLEMQARFRPSHNWDVNGFWTIQLKNDGNYEGEAENLPGVTSSIGDFPEGFDPMRNEPFGRLQDFERHRVRVWSIHRMGLGQFGDLSLSGLLRLDSGRVYSLIATNQPLTSIQADRLAGYPDAPSGQKLYFGPRGSQTFPGYAIVDASMNYNLPTWHSLRPWVKLDIFNLLNNQKLIHFNTTVVPDPNSPKDSLGLATGYIKGPSFGQAQSGLNFPTSLGAEGGRMFRIAIGVRF